LEHRANDRIAIAEHVIVGNTQHSIPGRFDVRLPLTIVLRPTNMAIAIKLDDQRVLRTKEVDDVRADGVLSAKPSIWRRDVIEGLTISAALDPSGLAASDDIDWSVWDPDTA
jgi:hypothetical protein